MKRLFLVEDDASLGQSLFDRLSQDYAVQWEKSFANAIKQMNHVKKCDLAILDVGLPDGNGFELAKQIRAVSSVPFLFLTAQADAESRLQGYQLGAEEFIPKPFLLKELLLRIHHVLSAHVSLNSLQVGSLLISFDELSIKDSDGELQIIPDSEMKVLQILIRQAPQVIDRDAIMNEVWGVESDLSHRSIDNIIVKLRSYLKDESLRIKTVRGRGYQWLLERNL